MAQVTFGYMLYRGQDDRPELFCGLGPDGRAVFAPPKFASAAAYRLRPILYWSKAEANKDWEMLETTLGYNGRVELLQIIAGWSQFERIA